MKKRININRPTSPHILEQRLAGKQQRPQVEEPEPRARSELSEYPPDLVVIVRPEGQVVFVSRPIGGSSEDDVIGSSIYDLIFPEQHELMRNCLDQVFATGRAHGLELRGIQHYDADAWYECRVAPNLRERKVVSATIIARDITRHKRVEQELHQERDRLKRLVEERGEDLERAKAALTEEVAGRDATERTQKTFRAIIDEAGEAIFISDAKTGRVVDANETAFRWLRRQRADVIGKSASELELEFHIQPPEGLELQFTETRDTRRPLILDDGVHRRQDGSTFPVEVAVGHHTRGDTEYFLAVVRDAKGRKRAEEALLESEAQYRTLFEQSWDAIYLTTRAGKILAVNQAALDLFGYPGDEFVGLDARDLFPRPEDIRGFQREMAARGAVERLEVELRSKHGNTFQAYLSVTRRHSADGSIQGYQCIVRPVPVERGSRPEENQAAPESTYRPSPNGAVLLVEAEAAVRAELAAALGKAGMPVLIADTRGKGIELFREHAPEITVTVLDATSGEPELEQTLEAIVEIDPSAQVVVMSPEDGPDVAADQDRPGVVAVLKQPVHPLALLQMVREIRPLEGEASS